VAYKQLKSPNLDPYINEGGVILQDWLGWCLAYVKTAYGASGGGYTAWEAWTNTKYKHTGTPPSGVYVPIWFSYYEGSKNWGHVAIYKDGTIWSSPISHKPYADVWSSIAKVESNYRSKYVGWSEDVGNLKVIAEEGELIMTAAEETNAYKIVLQRNPEAGAVLGKRTGYQFITSAVPELTAQRNAQAKQVSDLQAQIDKNSKIIAEQIKALQVKDANMKDITENLTKLMAENALLKEQLAKPVDEKTIVEGWFRRLWNSLFNK